MARKRKTLFKDTDRKILIGYFHVDGINRAIRRDICTFEERDFKITKKGRNKKRTSEEREAFVAKRYESILIKIIKEQAAKSLKGEIYKTIKSISEEWLITVGNNKPTSTYLSYKRTIEYYLKSAGNYPIDAHEDHYADKFKKYLIKRNNSAFTITKHLRQLQIFFNWAKKKRKSKYWIKIEVENPTKKDMEIYSKSELKKMEKLIISKYYAANTEYRKMMFLNDLRAFYMFRDSGLRRGEVLFLPLKHIDLRKNLIEVRGNEEMNWQPKGYKIRDVSISDRLYQFLIDDIKSRSGDEKYYLDDTKGRPYLRTLDRMTTRFRKYCEELGIKQIKPRLKPLHGFRSTVLTNLDETGATAFQIAAIAGHSDISTTMKYVKSKQKPLKDALDRIS
jgi:integrase